MARHADSPSESRPRWGDLAVLVGRGLLAVLFLAGALQKIADPETVMALLRDAGLPAILVWPAMAFNAMAGLALILGVAVRPVALTLAGYCAVTSIFHLIPADPWQISIFIKNWAIAGGCLILAAHGPGRYVMAQGR